MKQGKNDRKEQEGCWISGTDPSTKKKSKDSKKERSQLHQTSSTNTVSLCLLPSSLALMPTLLLQGYWSLNLAVKFAKPCTVKQPLCGSPSAPAIQKIALAGGRKESKPVKLEGATNNDSPYKSTATNTMPHKQEKSHMERLDKRQQKKQTETQTRSCTQSNQPTNFWHAFTAWS